MKKSSVPNDILQGTVYKKNTYMVMISFENGHNFHDACSYSCHRISSGGGSGTGSSSHSSSSKSLSSTSLSAILSID